MSENTLSPAIKKAAALKKELRDIAKDVQTEFLGKLDGLKEYFVNSPDEMAAVYNSESAKNVLKALGLKFLRLDVTADEILAFLTAGQKKMSEIVKFFDFKRATISKRLKELEADGKIKSSGKGKLKTYQKI